MKEDHIFLSNGRVQKKELKKEDQMSNGRVQIKEIN